MIKETRRKNKKNKKNVNFNAVSELTREFKSLTIKGTRERERD